MAHSVAAGFIESITQGAQTFLKSRTLNVCLNHGQHVMGQLRAAGEVPMRTWARRGASWAERGLLDAFPGAWREHVPE